MRADHKLHLCYGFIIAVMGFFGMSFFTDNIWYALLAGLGLSTLAGLVKEVYDRNRAYGTRRFDGVDWWYTVVGGLAFSGSIAIMKLLIDWIG